MLEQKWQKGGTRAHKRRHDGILLCHHLKKIGWHSVTGGTPQKIKISDKNG